MTLGVEKIMMMIFVVHGTEKIQDLPNCHRQENICIFSGIYVQDHICMKYLWTYNNILINQLQLVCLYPLFSSQLNWIGPPTVGFHN